MNEEIMEKCRLTDEEIIEGVNDGGYAEGGELVKLSEAGRKEYLGVVNKTIRKAIPLISAEAYEKGFEDGKRSRD